MTNTDKIESIATKLSNAADELKSLYPDSVYTQRIIDAIIRASNAVIDLEFDHDCAQNDPDYDPNRD